MRSQTTLIETKMGTDNRAPGTLQTQVQKISAMTMTTGLRVKRRPSSTGMIKLASRVWSRRYQVAKQEALPECVKGKETDSPQQKNSGDRTQIGNKIGMLFLTAAGGMLAVDSLN